MSPDQQKDRLARALAAVQDMRGQLEEARQAQTQPVAILGMACRFPGGVVSPEDLWNLLCAKKDAIRVVPRDRWDIDAYFDADPEASGGISTRCGGFVEGIDLFDPHFFGIAPREARDMDPQQRMLLEVAWEAMERAGLAADKLRGSRTGVFVGISSGDYAQLLLARGPGAIDSYLGSGNAHSTASGRLSYVFGFEGPSVAIDTACSSSLVAIHLACQSLRNGESDLAVAGGVNALLTPYISINHSRARMLAPDGRCKAFDAAADGFIRSEGCGLVVLKRLSHALADGDPICAVIRGSAVNQDGHSSGLTVPNGAAQQSVMRQALAASSLSPEQIGYIEAHGTGTALGDPIELTALAGVYGEGRNQDEPVVVGSIKTNIGHAEAAAGIAGLIKAVLCLKHESIPPNLHFKRPNPRLEWNRLPLRVPTEITPWPSGSQARYAAVSSFGFGGTNAHAVLAEAPKFEVKLGGGPQRRQILTLSAPSESALKKLASAYAGWMATISDADLRDACHFANAGRRHWGQRLTVQGDSSEVMREELVGFARALSSTGCEQAKAHPSPAIAFLFTGQGAQFSGMGRVLFETEPVFRETLLRCASLMTPHLSRPLLEVIFSEKTDDGLLNETAFTQPALFALEFALAKTWLSWGIKPSVLMGHSVGEYAAACIAGVFGLEDAVLLITARGRLMQALPSGGGMLAVFADLGSVRQLMAGTSLSVAAINGPRHVVVSGALAEIESLVTRLEPTGIEARRLRVSHAFHSPAVDAALEQFRGVAEQIHYSEPQIDLISNVSGDLAGSEIANAAYWVRHAREPVQFEAGMRCMEELGSTAALEIGPHPVLIGMGRQCIKAANWLWLPSLKRGDHDWHRILSTLGALYRHGASVDWNRFESGRPRRDFLLPTFPFERDRYWVSLEGSELINPATIASESFAHSLLGNRLHLAGLSEEVRYESILSADSPAWLKDHRVSGVSILPASGYIEMALAGIAPHSYGWEVRELVFHQPMSFDSSATERVVQIRLVPEDAMYRFSVFSRQKMQVEKPQWVLHATAELHHFSVTAKEPVPDLNDLRRSFMDSMDVANFYGAYRRLGIDFGPSFKAVKAIWRRSGEVLGKLEFPSAVDSGQEFILHPALLDACAQVLGATVQETDSLRLQARINRVRIFKRCQGVAWCYARISENARDDSLLGDFYLLDESGDLVAAVLGQEARSVTPNAIEREPSGTSCFRANWLPKPRRDLTRTRNSGSLAAELTARLQSAMSESKLITYGAALTMFEALSPVLIARALIQLGWTYIAGDQFTTGEACRRLKVAVSMSRPFQRFLEILQESGVLRKSDERWLQVTALPSDDPTIAWEAGHGAESEFKLLQRCAGSLADVLRGAIDPLQVLFADGENGLAERIYRDSPGAEVMNGLLAEAVAQLLAEWPTSRPLRVLEIGAGTGGATAYVLPKLGERQVEYLFTDVSPGFLSKAQERFRNFPFIRFDVLDIERSPAEQGFAPGYFDLVIAFNVLHATRLLGKTVGHVHELLAAAGHLLLLENTQSMRWVDLIWGLTPGWWRFEDVKLRPKGPLLSIPSWREILGKYGFTQVEQVSAPENLFGILARQSLFIARKEQANGVWLVVGEAGGFAQEIVEALRQHGYSGVRAVTGACFSRIGNDLWGLDTCDREHWRRLLEAVPRPLSGVIFLADLDAKWNAEITSENLMNEAVKATGACLLLGRTLRETAISAPLWIVTRGAQSLDNDTHDVPLTQVALWGAGKTLAREMPELWGGLIDLDPKPQAKELPQLVAEVMDPDGEDLIAMRGRERHVARIFPLDLPHQPESKHVIHSDAAYLVTGGCGALGLMIADWLHGQGARQLILVGRHGASSLQSRQMISALQAKGTEVKVFRADVSDEAACRAMLEDIEAHGWRLRGVFHAAGLPGYKPVAELELQDVEDQFRAKVRGGWLLHQLTLCSDLDFFVLCSSMVALWGATGQAHYVAANEFLDSLALHRQRKGMPGLSINWGPLRGGGMLNFQDIPALARLGIRVTPLEQAPLCLSDLILAGVAQAAPVDIDWSVFRSAYDVRGRCRLFDEISTAPNMECSASIRPHENSSADWAGLPYGELRERMAWSVRQSLGKVLGMDQERLRDGSQGFFDLGMDSLTSMELRNQLQLIVGRALPSTLAFDYPSVDRLVEFLCPRAEEVSSPSPIADEHESTRVLIESMTDAETERLLLERLAMQ